MKSKTDFKSKKKSTPNLPNRGRKNPGTTMNNTRGYTSSNMRGRVKV